jgi:ribosome biogenesis protein SSF1/2
MQVLMFDSFFFLFYINILIGTPEGIFEDVPKSIVAKSSKVVPNVAELVRDIRKMMSPYTATNLRERSFNRMKDYAAVAGKLAVSHLITISQTKSNIILRIARSPNGPTLHFKVQKYSLSKHVRLLQKRPFDSAAAFSTSPLVVLNNFGQCEESHVKLMRVTFQNMFPAINIKTIKLTDCRRVVLYHYNKEDGTVEMRHYAIKANPVGINRSVKKVLESKIPDLGNLEDISEYIHGQGLGAASDSEAEDESTRVVLPDRFSGQGNAKLQQSAMKLIELGPRLTMDIFKVEKEIGEGDILYHKYETKTAAESKAQKAKIEKAKMIKLERKSIQEENVKRKREAIEEKRKAKDLKRSKKENNSNSIDDDNVDESEDNEDESDDNDDEAEDNVDESEDNDDDSEEFEEEST